MNDNNKQTETGPAKAAINPIRLRCGAIVQKVNGNQLEVSVTLEHEGREFSGFAAGGNGEHQRRIYLATATLSAVHAFLGIESSPFRLLSVKRITSTPVPICMVLMEFVSEAVPTVLVGAAEMVGDEAVSVQRATMDAINRKVSILFGERFG